MTDSREARVQELEAEVQMLREQLIQCQKTTSVGVLASSITHEFNNILMTVINYAKMGIRHKDAATRDKSFDKILAAGQRASKITTGMLSYARRQHDRREPMDLLTLVDDVALLIEKDLQMHRVRLEKRVDGTPWASVNSGQIQQVLLNLMINARQAMDGGGTLTVSVRAIRDEEAAEISVRDTGCGMSPEQLEKLFQPFFTTKTPDKQGQGGTGLGLSLAQQVMDAHAGKIRVESTLGRGTTFTLRFPLVAPPVVPATTSTTVPARQRVG